MFGKLTWDAIPWSQPIPLVAGSVVVLTVLAILAWVVLKGYLPYLWREWITSVDHKRIGVMYTLLGVVMLWAWGHPEVYILRAHELRRAAAITIGMAAKKIMIVPWAEKIWS